MLSCSWRDGKSGGGEEGTILPFPTPKSPWPCPLAVQAWHGPCYPSNRRKRGRACPIIPMPEAMTVMAMNKIQTSALANALKQYPNAFARPSQVVAITEVLVAHGLDRAKVDAAMVDAGIFTNASAILQDLKRMGIVESDMTAAQKAMAQTLKAALLVK